MTGGSQHDGFMYVINLAWPCGTDEKCMQEIWHLSKFHVSNLVSFHQKDKTVFIQ